MEKVSRDISLTPDSIIAKLFTFHARAHYFHLQTTSYAMHKNLDGLYKALEESRDDIAEYLLGVQVPKRLNPPVIEPTGPFSDMAVATLLNDGWDFTVQLCEYAEQKGLEQLCNLSSDLQGEFTRAKYFNTFK